MSLVGFIFDHTNIQQKSFNVENATEFQIPFSKEDILN